MVLKFDPFREMSLLQRNINRLFEHDTRRKNGFGETLFPAMDISETDHEVKVRALLPGMKKEDVKVSLHQNVLSISGEKKAVEIPEDARVLRHERSSGRFQRTFRLNKPVVLDNISANLSNGVLTLTLPLKDEAKPKQIEVSVN